MNTDTTKLVTAYTDEEVTAMLLCVTESHLVNLGAEKFNLFQTLAVKPAAKVLAGDLTALNKSKKEILKAEKKTANAIKSLEMKKVLKMADKVSISYDKGVHAGTIIKLGEGTVGVVFSTLLDAKTGLPKKLWRWYHEVSPLIG